MTLESEPSIEPTAFVALDFATYIVDNFSHDPDVVMRAAHALGLARAAGILIVHVLPEPLRDDIHPMMAAREGEPVLGKMTIGAFASTPLHDLLQDAGVRQIIVAGVATSGTVLSTSRWAHDVGYRVIVCSDACADPDPEAHAALLDSRVFPESWLGLWRIATVLPADEIPNLNARFTPTIE